MSAVRSGDGFSLSGADLLIGAAVTVLPTFALIVVHEGVHGLVIVLFDA